MAPHDGGIDFVNVTDWCMATFEGQTDCADIRDRAESDALELSRCVCMSVCGALAVCLPACLLS